MPESPISTSVNDGRASYHNLHNYSISDNCNMLHELLDHPGADLHVEHEPDLWDMYLTAGPSDGDPPHLSRIEDSIFHSAGLQTTSHWNPSVELCHAPSSNVADSIECLDMESAYRCQYPAPPRIVTKVEETSDLPISGSWADTSALIGSTPEMKGLASDMALDFTSRVPEMVHHGPQQYNPSLETGNTIRPVGSEALSQASMKRRERDASYRCKYCGSTFTAKHNLKSKCLLCTDDTFTYVDIPLDHLNSHEGIRPYECEGCFRSFGTKHVLNRHRGTCGYVFQGSRVHPKRLH
ncbi:hypothetical protein VNI00_013594 [Paramarasmius palmivorus]|uniref:C2H2-type domain-containing protein n=1 Tax=Paramarasmius palmivorus TaxID=297713 RepID=A0AAW0BW52_9AGAR